MEDGTDRTSYEQLYERFVDERGLDHDPAGWGDEDVAAWRGAFADWEGGARGEFPELNELPALGVPPVTFHLGARDFLVVATAAGSWAVRASDARATVAVLRRHDGDDAVRFSLLGPGIDSRARHWRTLLAQLP